MSEAVVKNSESPVRILKASKEGGELNPIQDQNSLNKVSASNDIELESPQVESLNGNEDFESGENQSVSDDDLPWGERNG